MRPRPSRPVIHKFGGAALKDAASIRQAHDIFRNQEGSRVVVVSAVAGITDLLLDATAAAASGDAARADTLALAFRVQHRAIVADLGLPSPDDMLALIDTLGVQLDALLARIAVTRAATAAERDEVISRGERLSAALFAALLSASGEPALLLDPCDLIYTDGPFGAAVPNQAATRAAAQDQLVPALRQGKSVVVPGFLGRSPDGQVATLGRGGTDLTATVLARAIDAEHVTLWKDVPGLLTADPRVVPDARLLPSVHRLEAADLAWYGARILHPRALSPLTGTRITVHIRPFADPESSGTVIAAHQDEASSPVRGLAAVRQQTLITVSGTGVMGVAGLATKVFGALESREIPVTLVAQASAEAALDCTVPSHHAAEAVTVLREVLRDHIRRGDIDGVERRDGIGIVAIVGMGMAKHSGVAAKVFDSLADSGINVIAIAAGTGERNLSIVMNESETSAALRHIHSTFQLGKIGGGRPVRRTGRDVVLLGAGTIGRTVMRLLAANPAAFARLHIVAILDSQGACINTSGFSTDELRQIAEAKSHGIGVMSQPGGIRGTPNEMLARMLDLALVRPMLADMTASRTGPLLHAAAAAGWDLVLANKQPLAAPSSELDALHEALDSHHAKLRYEATVGAGLPVVEALQQLLATGDRIRSLEGCLSGTLGVVLSAVEAGASFSTAVLDARARGFTEPDPRDDLCGLDVARKALILARTLGVRHELEDIAVDSLVLSGAELPTDQWLEQLSHDDAIWIERATQARGRGTVLRYVATITPTTVTVGLKEVPMTHPLAQLQGAANQLVFSSDRYHDSPLVITGPGAGPEVTATGVLADLLALAR